MAKRFPAVGFTVAATEAVLERDARVVLQQIGLAKFGRVLHECPFTLHVAMPGEDEQVDLAPLFVRPTLQRSRGGLRLAKRSQIGRGVIVAVLQLAKRTVVVVQPDRVTDLHAHVRRRNVFRQRIDLRDSALSPTDGVHPWPQIHSPYRLGAKFADVKFQLR